MIIHEAGHALVGTLLGYPMSAGVKQAHAWALIEDPVHKSAIAVAGAIAEIAHESPDMEACFNQCQRRCSRKDVDHTSGDKLAFYRGLAIARELLLGHLDKLDAIARRIHSNNFITFIEVQQICQSTS